MPVEISKFDPNNLEASEKYLLRTLATEIITDVANPYKEEYMEFTGILAGHFLPVDITGKKSTDLWKKIYKAFQKSEQRFNYKIYKGHLLTEIAVNSLASECDLDKAVMYLVRSYEEDKLHGYIHPEHRQAYKILSFIQPILMFKNELWPSEMALRRKITNRLFIVFSLNRSATVFDFGPDSLHTDIAKCIPNNKHLLDILVENANEPIEVSMLSDQKGIFYKSTAFLIANITEGILFDLALRFPEHINPERVSITKLAKRLRQEAIIDETSEYCCLFIQHYRDFIHPARNLKHGYNLEVNFNKMFLLFFVLLLDDLAKSSKKLETSKI